jgi:hypothetical protein
MAGSVVAAREQTGVSTSNTPWCWKNARICAITRARKRSVSMDAAGDAPEPV